MKKKYIKLTMQQTLQREKIQARTIVRIIESNAVKLWGEICCSAYEHSLNEGGFLKSFPQVWEEMGKLK